MPVSTEALKEAAIKLFQEYVTSEMFSAILEPAARQLLLDSIEGITRPEILDAAKASREIVEEVYLQTMGGLAEVTAMALEDQIGVDGFMRELVDNIGLREDQVNTLRKYKGSLLKAQPPLSDEEIEKLVNARSRKMIQQRAEMIAHDQMAKAASAGELNVMVARGMEYKRWIHSADSTVSDGCLENGFAGWIPVNQEFPSGHKHPSRHPRCRCALGFKVVLGNNEKEHNDEQAKLLEQYQTARASGDKAFHPYADVEHSTA